MAWFVKGHKEGDSPPEEGDEVQVKWTDGELYGATFRAANSHVMYTVSRTCYYCKSFLSSPSMSFVFC